MIDYKNTRYQEPIVIVEVVKLSIVIMAFITVYGLVRWSLS